MTYIPAAMRREVVSRAGECCEYCRIPQSSSIYSFHIEHITAEKHGGETLLKNLCLSCPDCNMHKGSDLTSIDPQTKRVELLFNPREQVWGEHFTLDGARILPVTAAGRVTVSLLRMNAPERVAERDAMIQLGEFPC